MSRTKTKAPAVATSPAKAPASAVIEIPNAQKEFFTMKEAAEYLRCSYWAIREACYTGNCCTPR